MNKVIIIGRLGQDPEVRDAGGTAVCNFSVATSERFKNKETEEWEEKTEWHRIVAWGKTAENVGKYLTKGKQVGVEGSLQTNKWEDKDGNARYTTEVKARNVEFLGSKGDGAEAVTPATKSVETQPFEKPMMDDDLPF